MAKRKDKPKRKPAITEKRVREAEDAPAKPLPAIVAKPEEDADGWDEQGITPRQRAFVEALLGRAGGNASKAAELAGYRADNRESLKVTASRMLTYANVQRHIERTIAARFGTDEDVRRGIAAIANGNAGDYLEPDERGRLVVSLEKLAAAGQLGLVHEIREEGFQAGEVVTIVKRKLKMYDRLKALELLGRLNGQFVEQHKHSGELKFHPITLEGDKEAAKDDG